MSQHLACMCKAVLWIVVVTGYNACTKVSAETYYVMPTSANYSCPEDGASCFTLHEYATKPDNYSVSNISLVLLPGNHILDSELRIENITFLSITGSKENGTIPITVACSTIGRFLFESINEVRINDLVLHGCEDNVVTSVSHFILKDCTLFGHTEHAEQNRTGLTMSFVDDVRIVRSTFYSFIADNKGGAIRSIGCKNVSIISSKFQKNRAKFMGGALSASFTNLLIQNSTFFDNIAEGESEDYLRGRGGALYITKGSVTISSATFCRNFALIGGALYSYGSVSTIHDSTFLFHTAKKFTYMYMYGSAIYIGSSILSTSGFLDIQNNDDAAVFSYESVATLNGHVTLSNNKNISGLYAFVSDITILGIAKFKNNGRAIVCAASNITLLNTVSLTHSSQSSAILASDCKVNSFGKITIAYNTALMGGGIAIHQSELNLWGVTNLIGNSVYENGGGLYAAGSTINVYGGVLHISGNSAKKGGGLYLDNAKLLVKKLNIEFTFPNGTQNRDDWIRIEFSDNLAEYGGAVYVNDINSGACAKSSNDLVSNECFFQIIPLHNILDSTNPNNINFQNLYVENNTASEAGRLLYGGLMDRCIFLEFGIIHGSLLQNNEIIAQFVHTREHLDFTSPSVISSDPVQMAICSNEQLATLPKLHVKKDKTFIVSVVAVNQVGHPVPAVIRSYLSHESSNLGRGQERNDANATCTNLKYSVSSPHHSEILSLYPDGPCRDIGISRLSINIEFEPCPIGFEESEEHKCDCNQCLKSLGYISNCSIDEESVLRKEAIWISLDKSSGQFVAHGNCPFDYCRSGDVNVNLNEHNRSDDQCNFNRSGILCGSCKDGFSLSLGSSRCIICSDNKSLALLIVFALAGVALVAILLLLNLTVAAGTINGLIFYANVIVSKHATFFPTDKLNAFPFIAWLNLDFGFEVCFYENMDSYAYVWLQFVFPMYILLLVVAVIIVAHYSKLFSKLISNRNPVATLATLILLSYTKLLRTIISSLYHTKIVYIDGTECESQSSRSVWLVDGNINYLQGKHFPLFLVALLVLLVGLAYTVLLFMWQWLQPHLNKSRLQCFKNVILRLTAFMEAYHAPYNTQHRYWTGLLLFVRVALFCVPVFTDTGGDSRPTLVAIVCTSGGLLLYKEFFKEKIYKNLLLNALESTFLFNLVVFATATLYIDVTGREEADQAALAYASTIIAFLTCIVVVIYHTFTSFKLLNRFMDNVKTKILQSLQQSKKKPSGHKLSRKSLKKIRRSKKFNNQFRESVLNDNFVAKEYVIVEDHPSWQSIESQRVTHTEIDGIPPRSDFNMTI